MKLTFRDLYGDEIDDLVYDLDEFNVLDTGIAIMPRPVKYIYINNVATPSRLEYMPRDRPIIIPFRVGKYSLRLDYDFFND